SVVPFVNEVINLDSQNPGPGATFFYPAFQFRFRNIGTSSSSSHFDHWLIDDVFFGLPTNTPIMAVNPQSLSDTLLAGATNTLQFEISNTNSLPSNLNFTVAENPAVDWLSVSPSSGTIASSGTQSIDVQLDASGLSSGAFTTDLVVSGDDPNNTNDTVVVNLEVNDAPVVGVSADSIEFALDPNQTDSTVMTITNSGGGPLHFQLSDEDVFPETTLKPVIHMPEPQHELSLDFGKGEEDWRRGVSPHYGLGGPDNFGYRWIDSDEPNGPVFNWQDISGVGTAVSLNDDDFIEVQLPFSFSFYGNMVDMIKISSNGYLTFGADGTDFSNDPIPDPLEPNHIIAPFWDDLNPTIGGTIHYHSDANQFIVQYTNIQHFGGSAPYTFQVILDSNGKILYQYLDMQGDVTSATIGIENVDASDGLEVAFNAPYVHDNLAVRIAADTPWLSENPTNGTVPAGGTLDVQVIADAAGLSSGDYHARIIVASNDPQNSELEVPVNLQVGSFARITTSPDSVIFSDTVVVNQQATQSLFIHNLGNADLNVSEMLSTSAVFSANPQQVLVPPGDSVNVTVTYAPTAAGQDSGLLQLVSNDPNHDTLGV
ncbi:MAG: choice-of-anchor D domain-containing protein, partial [candidate division Zixibacteria bacterium]|nr:choice-of-anchor D domain-containing protein [Gammaproteobacteria bacterium]NIX57878.1 choice-of-anchor D domain-containing protein [candidate division Zixibacteria bacterium]